MSSVPDVHDEVLQVTDGSGGAGGGSGRIGGRGGHRCLVCGERRSLFSHRGVVKADRSHTLCFECYRAELNRQRARRLAEAQHWLRTSGPAPARSKLIGDRDGLRAELDARRRRAQIAARHALDSVDRPAQPTPLAS
jgi:hypothetical protein